MLEGRWDNIFICNEQLRLSVFTVMTYRDSDTNSKEKYIFDHQWSKYCKDSKPFIQAIKTPSGEHDIQVHKLNSWVQRLIMMSDMKFWPGYTHLKAAGDNPGDLYPIDARSTSQGKGIIF